ncbi:MAG: M20/M25/M40 family metallo-hydrolase [Phycisphaerales bacterium]|nr:M20/M25/M40 family metallo-hydrolase [Phycisphaerales bacterium]
MPANQFRVPSRRSCGLSAALLLALLAGCESGGPRLPESSLGPDVSGLSSAQLISRYGSKISSDGNSDFELKPIGKKAAEKGLKRFAVVDNEPVPVPEIAMGDSRTVARILDEGLNRNQVLDHLRHLTTQIGPRLTGSSNAEAANRWTRDQFESWGLTNAHLDEWGNIGLRFDRGPSTAKVMRSRERRGDGGQTTTEWESIRDMAFTTLAWAPGTQGPVRAPVIRMPTDTAEFEAVKDKLPGAWVMMGRASEGRTGVRGAPGGMRAYNNTFAEIRKKWANPEPPMPQDGRSGLWKGKVKGAQTPGDGMDVEMSLRFAADNSVTGSFNTAFGRIQIKDGRFNPDTGELTFAYARGPNDTKVTMKLTDQSAEGTSVGPRGESTITATRDPSDTPKEPSVEERVLTAGPAGFLITSGDERVWTSAADGWREMTPDTVAKDVIANISQPDYDFINSRLADGLDFQVEMDVKNIFTAGPIPVYNTVAEIRGSEKPDEIVIVSAHLDSWNGPGSQGCTDNGTGSSVTLEAARILSTVIKNGGKPPKRTIRFILWTGEEQGLLGSAGYVKKHEDDLARISAVFVDDGGTNYEGGLNCLEQMVPYLAAATAPVNSAFPDLTVNVHVARNDKNEPLTKMPGGGGSDHATFNAKGVPGFFWDEVGRANYGYGWHTQHDRFDLAIPEYLVQSSTCAAVTAYNLACAPDLLPREVKEAPKEPAK